MGTEAGRRGNHDLRSCYRLGTCLRCSITSDGVSSQAFLMNVSLTGASISCRQILPNGSLVSIVVSLPELKKNLTLEGFIVQVAHPRSDTTNEVVDYGVRFNSPRPDTLVLIKTLMAKNLTRLASR